jgi:hypothetical protein
MFSATQAVESTVDVTALVDAWLADPARNFGVALTASGTNGTDFVSREGDAPARPQLRLMYRLPPR